MSTRTVFRLLFSLSVLATPVLAGEVNVAFEPSATASGYKIYRGESTGQYDGSMDVGSQTQATVAGLPDCATAFLAATAYNAAGESGFSNEVSSWPRPEPDAISPQSGEQGTSLDLTLSGTNFRSGATVEFNHSGVTVNSVNVDSCNAILLNITIDPGAAAGPVEVSVSNPSGVTGNGSGLFAVEQDGSAPVIFQVEAVDVTATSARINWSTDEPASSQVFYRTVDSSSYQETTPDAALVTGHSQLLQGLDPDTIYDYHVESVDADGNGASSSPDDSFTTFSSPFSYIRFEAEVGDLTAPVRVQSGSAVFGGAWIDTPAGLDVGTAENPLGTAEFGVHIPQSATWYLWIRIYGVDSSANSWFESMDGAELFKISPTNNGVWEWVASREYDLDEGLHTLVLGGREPETRADRILLTDDPDFVPGEQPGADVSPPQAVSQFTATPGLGRNELSWVNPDDGDLERTIVRFRTDGRFPVSPADGLPLVDGPEAAGSTGTHAHTGLTTGVTYSYSAFAVDGSGNAAPPAQVQGTPGGVPAAPQNLRLND